MTVWLVMSLHKIPNVHRVWATQFMRQSADCTCRTSANDLSTSLMTVCWVISLPKLLHVHPDTSPDDFPAKIIVCTPYVHNSSGHLANPTHEAIC